MATEPTDRKPVEAQTATKKPATVDEYIAGFPEDVQRILESVRETVRAAAPEAEERMSWQMPTYHQKENLVHFAAQKKHLGFYPAPEAIIAFADRLAEYKTTKGAVQFPFGKPIPYDLIDEMTRFRVESIERR